MNARRDKCDCWSCLNRGRRNKSPWLNPRSASNRMVIRCVPHLQVRLQPTLRWGQRLFPPQPGWRARLLGYSGACPGSRLSGRHRVSLSHRGTAGRRHLRDVPRAGAERLSGGCAVCMMRGSVMLAPDRWGGSALGGPGAPQRAGQHHALAHVQDDQCDSQQSDRVDRGDLGGQEEQHQDAGGS